MNRASEIFCLEFAKTGNGVQSYKKSHPNCKSTDAVINATVCKLLKNPTVKDRLREIKDEMDSEKIAQASEIQERLTRILRQEAEEEVVVTEGIGDGCSEARIIKKKPTLKDVINAGTTLARMQGSLDSGGNVNVIVPVFGGESELKDD